VDTGSFGRIPLRGGALGSGGSPGSMARSPLPPDEDALSNSRAEFGRDAEGGSSRARSRKIVIENDEPDDRFTDLETEEQSPFLRAQKRVPVRRGAIPKKTAHRVWILLIGLVVLGAIAGVGLMFERYGTRSWRFRIESSDQIEIAGMQNVTRKEIMRVLGGDIGKNIFSIPLEEHKKKLEEIPWVESAAVMRYLPNRLKVEINERKPVAFVQIGSKIELIDPNGVIMNMPAGSKGNFSFPVIVGTSDAEPLSTRASRMKVFSQLMADLDFGGANYSKDVNEVDLTDPEDVKITVPDPAGAVLIHLGSANFLERYKIYVSHAQEWRQHFQKLESVDLRYERQVIVNPDSRGERAQSVPAKRSVTPTPVAAKRIATQKPVQKPAAHVVKKAKKR
jgi:cell division protein FtsQ